VHVWKHGEQLRVLVERHARVGLVIRLLRGDVQILIRYLCVHDTLRRRLLRKEEADAAAIGRGLTVRGVMHLEVDVPTLWGSGAPAPV
jgi:hypothetical protein